MSNEKITNNKKNKTKTAPLQRPKKKKYADDRTPAVKKVDKICKFLAVLLSLLFFANVHVLVRGGGYDDTKVVTVLGFGASKMESSIMEPDIEAKSAVFIKAQKEYSQGDAVQYFDGKYNPVRRVTDVSDDGETYTVVGDNESKSEAVKIKADDIKGKVFFTSKMLYGFIKVYATAFGAAVTVILSFLLLMMSDILMFRKRKAVAQAKREAYAKKQARKLQVKQGLEAPAEEELNPIEKRRAEKEAKLEKERAEIAAEMKAIQKKMKAEEEELKKGKRGKKK